MAKSRFHIYKLADPQSPVTLSVTIDNVQNVSTNLFLNKKPLQSGLRGSFSFDIQDSVSLAGKILDIETLVTGLNPDDDVSYQIKLSGGQSVFNQSAEPMPIKLDGSVTFYIKVTFM